MPGHTDDICRHDEYMSNQVEVQSRYPLNMFIILPLHQTFLLSGDDKGDEVFDCDYVSH